MYLYFDVYLICVGMQSFFQNQLLKVDLREAVAQNLASEAEKFEMESEAASEEDATVRPVQNVTPVNHRSQIPVLTWN
jgi:hypothetical protein